MGRADALKPSRHKGGHPPLPRAELPVDTVSLARYLIGKVLVREMAEGVASGRIVETEAYVVGDAAGHAYRGMTPRNRSLFLERGDVDALHLHHRLEGPSCACPIGIADQPDKLAGYDLPRHAEAVFYPAA